ncbi:MAG: hypothetical protein U7126_13530 [Microcoleus sp.]
MNLKCSHCHFIVTLFIISQFNSSVNVQKPGFSDNSGIAAEILFRNPVFHPHAIARNRVSQITKASPPRFCSETRFLTSRDRPIAHQDRSRETNAAITL